jgi:Ser/Thr protein kinase RdoA (MazF antagonist)
MPGQANYDREPTDRKLRAALATLARFHLLAETARGQAGSYGPPPGILERRRLMQRLLSGEAQQIRQAVSENPSGLAGRAQTVLEQFAHVAPRGAAMLDRAIAPVDLQPCIRDIWHDHILYTGDEVTGIIDFGALRTDCVSGDIARLLGSLVGDCAEGWAVGLDAYSRVRPLSRQECQLVETLDATNVILSGMNWLRWIYLENRRFEDISPIVVRLDLLIARLEHLADRFA